MTFSGHCETFNFAKIYSLTLLTTLILTDYVGVHDPITEAAEAPAEQHLPQRGAQGGQHDAR